ncbi:MAG: glycosyl hydrolase 53 family protein [Paludibacteraceae bacterium]|nr:glycosyl hydrolase 53 family protein [Paludibacteraceae bacterium]
MKKTFYLLFAVVSVAFCACTGKPATDSPRGTYAKGADLSWLTEQERDSVLFYNDNGEPQECIALLRSLGMNAVRLRVWVNHTTGWCNKPDVVAKAVRATALGQRIMIDFHYSDNFADPSNQTVPAEWQNYDLEQMCQAVTDHTVEVLTALREAGVNPEWVQVGNETTYGMLWPMGRTQVLQSDSTLSDCEGGWQRYAMLTSAGYDAVKSVFPDAIVIVHHDNAYLDNTAFYHRLQDNGGKFDMIGLSHYPMMFYWCHKPWQEMNTLAEANVKRLAEEFGGKVMIAEVGMVSAEEELSAVVMQDFLNRMQATGVCAGVFYWEPQVFNGWKPREYDALGWGPYEMGAFTNDGRPQQALKLMLE